MKKNLGWEFYKNYYDFKSLILSIERRDANKTEEEVIIEFFENKNDKIFKEKFEPNDYFKTVDENNLFSLQTTYPGLLSGSGVTHETGKKGELKLGFSFDHTTGLPYLPGSTVKGAIRQVFPNHLRKKSLKIEDSNQRSKVLEKTDALEKYCCEYLFGEILQMPITPKQLLQIEWAIFEGKIIENINEVFMDNQILFSKIKEKAIPVYESDIFHDAFIEDSEHEKKLFLDRDFITPHLKPLKNPVPVQFMKVLPKVNWTFQFDLKTTKIDSLTLNSSKKQNIFKHILLDFGIGAKTNVGYGQLISIQ